MIWEAVNKEIEKLQAQETESPWEEMPVDFVTFNESPLYLNSFPLSKRQYQDILNVIGNDPTQIFSPERRYSVAVFVWGKGSGKDRTVSRLFAYIVYIMLCMRSPGKFLFGTDETDHLDIVNVARKGGQAREIFFSYFTATIKHAPWFKNNFTIRDAGKLYSKPTYKNQGVIEIGSSNIKFPKNIRAYAETSAFEGYEGFNLVLWVMDEASAFKSAAEVANAYGIYKTLTTSGSTRATKTFRPLGFVISYPRQAENDLTWDLYQQSFTSSHMYGSFGWSWQIKPSHLYCGKTFKFTHSKIGKFLLGLDAPATVEIPIELQDDFAEERDIADAMCKHLCIPPHVMEQWVEYPDIFYSQLKQLPDIFSYEDVIEDVWDEENQKWEKRVHKKFLGLRISPKIAKRHQYVAWLDAADTFCDAVICIGHVEEREGKEILIQDSELVWTPDPKRDIKISLLNVGYWLTTVIPQHLNIIAIGSDYWNSSAFAEALKSDYPNIRTVQANLNREDYDLMKRFSYSGQSEFHSAATVHQIVTLRRGTNKPTKGPGQKQDRADGWTGVVKLLKGVKFEVARNLANAPQTAKAPTPKASNIFAGATNPFSVDVTDAAFEHRLVNTKDFRKMLGIPQHRPIRSGDAQERNSNRRLPLSTRF